MKKRGRWIWLAVTLALLVAIGGCTAWYFSTENGSRQLKTWKSNNAGGLERTVKVYDQNGNLLQQYEGRIDIQDTEYGNKVLFDLNGKRIVIYNATVIVEEK
ncbi:hypothetical protein ACTHPH_05625 [Paenibacillus pasadenensis]|uniref:Lipoprotein n=1 Tax=Paenibacillus pasadenensis TaxID=217090 RepID=A0A2N5ND85_9BACL|nr:MULTISPECIES: hypothetical protein [Paenibacillus]PLT48230.1 hypothetical protein B8V81_0362 [Paenibacillus pasadenensis]QGG58263.1 hypothetical protein GE073_23580 [Paenibacillus sp. B01]